MAAFITAEDITDATLIGRITEEYIAGANEHLTRLAAVYGIYNVPVRPITKRLAVLVACRDYCLSLVGTDPTVTIEGSRNDDVYERKYKLYREQVNELSATLTKADFMEETDTDEEKERGAWARSVKLSRA